MAQGVFILAALAVLVGASGVLPGFAVGAPAALGVGIVLALAGLLAFEKQAKHWSKVLIQASIVLLGFSIPLWEVARAGLAGLGLSAGTIALVFVSGLVLGRALGTPREITSLLTAGTAICGGSAIAATGAVLRAQAASISLATAIVFLLNAGGVYAYPPIARALHLSDAQFGAWSAIGIHDTAGVVAAAKSFSSAALDQATIIKLTRVLWIVPVALALRWWSSRAGSASAGDPGASVSGPPAGTTTKTPATPIPWFIGLFLLACLVRTLVPGLADGAAWLPGGVSIAEALKWTGKFLLTFALFLIGTGLSRRALAAAGWRPLALAVIMWLIVSVASLIVIRVTIPA